MSNSLKDKTITGFLWSLSQKIGYKAIHFVIMLILVRILTPEIFGLIAMLMIFIELSETLVQAGFHNALIQKKNADEEHFSSVFWINLAISLLIYLIMYISAPWIAAFYDEEILIKLARVFSLVFLINAFSYVQEAKLTKEMKFKTLTIVHLPSIFIGGAVSIAMALLGYGVWSIIALKLVTQLAYAIQIWFHSGWRPLFSFNVSKAKDLFAFGGNLMVAMIIRTLFNNAYLVVIGKFFPLKTLGYYHYSNNLVNDPARTISSSLRTVTFSAMSAIQGDDFKLKSGYKQVIQQSVFWMFPLFIFTGVLAEPLIEFFFGTKWLPAAPFYQILCIIGVLFPLNSFNLNILNVKGRSDLYLKLEILKSIITIIGLIIVIPMGIWHLVVFQSFNMLIGYFINSYFSGRFIDYSVKEQLKDIFPLFLMNVGIATLLFLIDYKLLSDTLNIVRITVGLSTGVGLYWLLSRLFNIEAYNIFTNNILPKMTKGFSKK